MSDVTNLPPDMRVRRANAITTTFLDVLGVLLVAAGAGWALWAWVGPAAGLAGSGALILALSLVAQHRSEPVPVREVAVEGEVLPGPEDPGPLHVMGR